MSSQQPAESVCSLSLTLSLLPVLLLAAAQTVQPLPYEGCLRFSSLTALQMHSALNVSSALLFVNFPQIFYTSLPRSCTHSCKLLVSAPELEAFNKSKALTRA